MYFFFLKKKLLVVEDREPEPVIFCNQARLPVMGLGYQSSHKIFSIQLIVPARCAAAMVTQSLWECLLV